MNIRSIFFIVAALICVAPVEAQTNKITVLFDGLTFNSAYDNGALASLTRNASNDYSGTLYTDSSSAGTAKYWFRFTITNVAGRTVTVRLDHSQNPIPFVRVLEPGPGPWRRMTTTEAPSSSTTLMTLTFSNTTRMVELAFFDPMSYGETVATVNDLVASSPYASMAVLGKSYLGRDLHIVTVNNLRYPDAMKKRVWVHARVHAGEVTATHNMVGFLSQILEDSEVGRQLRENVIFTVVPQVNADGIYLGRTRWDSQGVDEEAQWCSVTIPEVAAMKSRVDGFMSSSNPISVALNLHSTVSNFKDSFFWKHLTPSVTANFESIQQRFIDAVNEATPLFDNLAPQTSQLNACTFIESYFWNNWGESVMAMTEEGHFYHRTSDNAWITGADYREIGKAMARALVTYYGLPPTAEPDMTFAAWQVQKFSAGELANTNVCGRLADTDGDGFCNLMEYALAMDPKVAEMSPILLSRDANGVTVNFPMTQHLTDVKFALDHSTDLVNWTREDLGSSTNLIVQTTRDVLRGGKYVDMVTARHPTTAPVQYYRLVAIGP